MKKFITAAAFAATLGAASSVGFANPFADVPADHWANDAIAQLAAAGIVEGYGDGTYRGDQEITRYEVAQIVAKAMAKEGVSGANKATIDKLAAEFAEELNSLGVRVSALEKKVDNVKWTGRLRYSASRRHNDGVGKADDTHAPGQILFRLEPRAVVNDHWAVKTRIEAYKQNINTAGNTTNATVNRAWATGVYGNTVIMLGKFPYQTNADEGLVLTDRMSGVAVTTGKVLKVDLFAARTLNSTGDYFGLSRIGNAAADTSGSVQGIQIYNDKSSKITAGVGYVRYKGYNKDTVDKQSDTANIFSVGAGYKFNKNLALTAGWSHNNVDKVNGEKFGAGKSSSFINLKYRQMNASKPGSYDVALGYRNIGHFGSVRDYFGDTNSITGCGDKYWELDVNYCIDKNIIFTGYFAKGKTAPVDGDKHRSFNAYWTEVCFLF